MCHYVSMPRGHLSFLPAYFFNCDSFSAVPAGSGWRVSTRTSIYVLDVVGFSVPKFEPININSHGCDVRDLNFPPLLSVMKLSLNLMNFVVHLIVSTLSKSTYLYECEWFYFILVLNQLKKKQ